MLTLHFNCALVNVRIISHMGLNEGFDYSKEDRGCLYYCQRGCMLPKGLLGSYCYSDQPLATWPILTPVRDKLYGKGH